MRKPAQPLKGKVVLVAVEESHIGRPLQDPAAQMAIAQRLRSLGFSVISPAASAKAGQGIAWILRTDNAELVIAAKGLAADWKESLMHSGKFSGKKVDFLLEGEGTSAFAAQLQGLTSCRARVELRLIPLPGRIVTTSDRGVAAGVDLVEALAAKAALEEAGTQACDALVRRWAGETPRPK